MVFIFSTPMSSQKSSNWVNIVFSISTIFTAPSAWESGVKPTMSPNKMLQLSTESAIRYSSAFMRIAMGCGRMLSSSSSFFSFSDSIFARCSSSRSSKYLRSSAEFIRAARIMKLMGLVTKSSAPDSKQRYTVSCSSKEDTTITGIFRSLSKAWLRPRIS